MVVSCKNCGGTDIDNDPARGDAVCVSCGSVVESLCMVSSVEFQENAAGNASVIGQFVSSEGMQHSVNGGYSYGVGRDHRQAILDNGKRMIDQMGGALKMSNHCLSSAYMFYKMAANKRFTSGRKTTHVIGACLYLVSRTEKTPHMLLDICDVVGCDVVSLGRVFLQLARELCIDCPIVDPSLYIHRFSHQLDFGEKENEVAMTALHIMGRMKKDWIHLGRRPSALCGAALIIAGKLYNFNVTMDDIVKLVRMSKTTVFKRLMDFSKTASGKLTTDEFKTVDLEEEADPPCYTEGRNRVKFAQETCNKYNFVSSDILSQVVKTQEKLEVLLEKRKNIRKELEERKKVSDAFDYRRYLPSDYSLYTYELDEMGGFKNTHFVIHKNDEHKIEQNNDNNNNGSDHGNSNDTNNNNDNNNGNTDKENEDNGDIKSVASSTLLMDTSIKKCEEDVSIIQQEECSDDAATPTDMEGGEIDLEDIDDDEIDRLLLTEDEIKIKTEVWLEENKEYLLKLKEKEDEEKRKEAEEAKYGTKKKRQYNRKTKEQPVCGSADEAIKTMLIERKLSSKINYDVLRGLKAENKGGGAGGGGEGDGGGGGVVKSELVEVKRELSTSKSLDGGGGGGCDDDIVYEDEPLTPKQSSKRISTLFPSIGSQNVKKIKLEDTPSKPRTTTSPTADHVVVESGPVAMTTGAVGDDDEDLIEDDDEDYRTASSLFSREVDEYDDYGGYDDDVDGFY